MPYQGDGQLCNVGNKQIIQPAAGEAVKGWKSSGEKQMRMFIVSPYHACKISTAHRHMDRIIIISPLEWKYKKPLN